MGSAKKVTGHHKKVKQDIRAEYAFADSTCHYSVLSNDPHKERQPSFYQRDL